MYILEVYEMFERNRIKALTMALSRFPSEITEAFISTYTKLDKDITTPIDQLLKSIKSDDFREIFERNEIDIEFEKNSKNISISFWTCGNEKHLTRFKI